MHEPQEYFVYFKARAAPDRGERADALPEKYVKSLINKKGSGANLFAPHHSSRFRIERSFAVGYPNLSDQADRTLRPFARRRARTLRPLAVAIL